MPSETKPWPAYKDTKCQCGHAFWIHSSFKRTTLDRDKGALTTRGRCCKQGCACQFFGATAEEVARWKQELETEDILTSLAGLPVSDRWEFR